MTSNDFTDTMVEQLLMRNDSNYILYDDMIVLINSLAKQFPNILTIEIIGETFEKRNIPMLTLTLNPNATSSLMLTGAHHARELSSIQLPLYGVLSLLHSYLHGNTTVQYLLSHHKLIVIPVINVDGYKLISDNFIHKPTRNAYLQKRKNTNNLYYNATQCIPRDTAQLFLSDYNEELLKTISMGVDLNRNYDWDFNSTEVGGSSVDPCQETYRGPEPFSESETRAIKKLMEEIHKEVKIAYNIHTFGNLFIHPFNSMYHNTLPSLYPEQYKIYEELWEEGGFPSGNLMGNSIDSLGYGANGDASDWMFGKFGIIAASPELGLEDEKTLNFFINDRALVLDLLAKNIPWILNSFHKLDVQFGIEHFKTEIKHQKKLRYVTTDLHIINKGFSDSSDDQNQTLIIKSNIIKQMSIEGGQIIERISDKKGNEQINVMIKTPKNSREKIEIQLKGYIGKKPFIYNEEQKLFSIEFVEYPHWVQKRKQKFLVKDIDDEGSNKITGKQSI